MNGEDLTLLEKAEECINDFDPTNIGSVITLAILVCVLLIPLSRSVYSTSVEEIFMGAKKRGGNDFFRLLALLVIFIPLNFVLLIMETFILFELLLGFGVIIAYFVYDREEAGTRKNMEGISELNAYYKEKKSDCFLFSIICFSPSMSILMNQFVDSLPLFSCAIIVSITETLIICISMPEFVNRSSNNYFCDNKNKIYIYERIEDDTVLCGDNPEKSKANKYITISYDNLKEKEIFHMQYESLSKTKKRELREKYKENRNNAKSKTKTSNTKSKNATNSK
jgi:hypothetical protein